MRPIGCVVSVLLFLACPAAEPAPPGPTPSPFGVPLPPAGELPQANLTRTTTWPERGDGLTEVGITLAGPNGEPVVRELVSLDGQQRVTFPTSTGLSERRVAPLTGWVLHVSLDGGSALSVPLDTGEPSSRLDVTGDFLKLNKGFRLAASNPAQPSPVDGVWVHRGTRSLLALWKGRFVEFSASNDAVGTSARDIGPADLTVQRTPCFPKEGTLVFVPLSTGTVAWDLSTHAVRAGAPADLETTGCQSARKGVARALFQLRTGGVSVIEWGGSSVSEVFREAGPVRPAFSADGSTVALMKDTGGGAWVTERITLATGTRSSEAANGPATPFLTHDGQRLLVLAVLGAGGVWGPCSRDPVDACLLFGADAMPLGAVQGLAVSDTESKLFVIVRDQPMGVQTDRLLHVDLATNTITPSRPPNYNGLPPTRFFVRGNLLPTHRGVAKVNSGTYELTGLGILTSALATDGSVYVAQNASPTSPLGVVDHETGVVFRGPFRPVTLMNDGVLSLAQRVVSRSATQVHAGGAPLLLNDAQCVLFTATDRLRRDGSPLSQSVYCSP